MPKAKENHRLIATLPQYKLKKARIEAKLDQEETAALLGKTQLYISKIESGQRRIDVVQLKEFAKTYKKSLDYFIKK